MKKEEKEREKEREKKKKINDAQLLSMEKTSINYTYRDGDVCFSFPEEPTLRNNQIWQKNGNAMTQVNREEKLARTPK